MGGMITSTVDALARQLAREALNKFEELNSRPAFAPQGPPGPPGEPGQDGLNGTAILDLEALPLAGSS